MAEQVPIDGVCLVIDIDGVQLKENKRLTLLPRFITREFAWCDWQGVNYGSFHYKPNEEYHNLPLEQRRCVNFVRTHITGLPFDTR